MVKSLDTQVCKPLSANRTRYPISEVNRFYVRKAAEVSLNKSSHKITSIGPEKYLDSGKDSDPTVG